jgi:hypothetical protein
MRKRYAGAAVVGLGCVTLSLALGQAPQPPAPPQQAPRQLPADITQAGFAQPATAVTPAGRDLTKLSPLTRQVHLCAQRGGEWLFRMNQPTGRFLPGWRPAVAQPVEDDHFVRQAGAALALARAATYFRNEGYAARARQAVLTLLAETGADPRDPHARCTQLPSSVCNRLGAAGQLLAAIHELPAPADDLLAQGEQLARFIYRQQRPDGSLAYTDAPDEAGDPDGVNHYPGLALYGLMRSLAHTPRAMKPQDQAWKFDLARKALAHYRAWWREHRHPAFAAAMIPACAELYLASKDRTKDAAAAEFCFEMADWLCSLQYVQLDPRHPHWAGGFQAFAEGRPVPSPPRAADAAYVAALVEAGRVTRQVPDLDRYPRYRDAAGRGAQFLATLQFTEANTQHFAPEYRQQYLLGGFHAANQDGDLRLDDTRQAVAALVQYLAGLPDQ